MELRGNTEVTLSVLSPFLFAVYLDDLPTVRSLIHRSFVVLYADDILLIAPSISELQQLLHNCEKELSWLACHAFHAH